MRRIHCPRGFTLNELLYVIGFVSLALVVEARLFKASMQVIETAPIPHRDHARLDRMSAALRRDVWMASAIELPDPATIGVIDSEGQRIRWSFGEAEAVRTEEGRQGRSSQRWPVPLRLRADRDGPAAVTLRPAVQATKQVEATQGRRFVSQVLLQAGGDTR
jgi:hypothetical protein